MASPQTVRVATAQFFSGTYAADVLIEALTDVVRARDVVANLEICKGWMQKASAKGARLVVFPENSNRSDPNPKPPDP